MEQQQATLQRRVEQDRQLWTKRLRDLEQRPFACEADAQTALTEVKKGVPPWLEIDCSLQVAPRYAGRGRPRAGVPPEQQVWTVHGIVSISEATVQAEVARKAKFLLATNVPAARKGAEDLIRLYKAQNGVERGFAFRECSALSGLVGIRQEDRARDGNGVRDGPLFARLPTGRAPDSPAPRQDGSYRARPTEEADPAPNLALGVSML